MPINIFNRQITIHNLVNYINTKFDIDLRILSKQINTCFIDQKKLIKNPKVIFDVGANIGQTSLIYNNLFPNAKILGFEPFTKIYKIYKQKFIKYQNIKTFNIALSDKKEKAKFYVNQHHYTNSLLPKENDKNIFYHDNDQQLKNIKKILIKTNTLNKITQTQNIKNIDILKIDVQGGELKVLKGASKQLREQLISLIYIEIEFVKIYKNQPLFHNICYYLQQYGYTLYKIYNLAYAQNGQLIAGDAIFINHRLRQSI